MRNYYRTILYYLSGLIVISGFLLFIFHNAVFDYAQSVSGLTVALSSVSLPGTPQGGLDTSPLANTRFTSLTNHVVNFNFDNICWRPDTVSQTITPVSVATTTETTSTPANLPLACHQGNGLPFVTK